jgi:hypothetical protein
VWIDSESGTVRFGIGARNRTLLAGIHPASYLVGTEHEVFLVNPDVEQILRFAPYYGVAADMQMLLKPSWCDAVEATLPDPGEPTPTWLEVGVSNTSMPLSCSIPQGNLPRLQAGLLQHGLHMTYITLIQVVPHVG